ncbi:MAG: amidase [Acidobacteria bacterium]|nr:amidase [Acidobacteriota bacterium]
MTPADTSRLQITLRIDIAVVQLTADSALAEAHEADRKLARGEIEGPLHGLGKTNVPELTFYAQTDNLVYGRTNNPYDLSCTPGGSSGGEAAIIAACGSPLGFGSDAGGSHCVPAHFCGITTPRPTNGRVSCVGHFPPTEGLFGDFLAVGPMARYVEDLVLTLPLVAGSDCRDPWTVPAPVADPRMVEFQTLINLVSLAQIYLAFFRFRYYPAQSN